MRKTRVRMLSRLTRFAGAAALIVGGAGAFAQSTHPATPTTEPAAEVAEAQIAPKAVTFDAAANGALEVIRAPSGHLLVKPRVNGKDVGWFIFDTGAGITCLDKAVADQLDLPDSGTITATGMGGDRKSRLRQLASLQLGPLKVEDNPVLELDLRSFQIFMGRPIAGIIGYECFGAAVYEIDLQSPTVTLHDPAKYELPAGERWSELQLIRRRPYVPGQIEGHEGGLFVLDIGSNTPLIVHTPTVDRFKLLDGRETKRSFSGGVGGMKSVRRGTVSNLTLCGHAVGEVEASFSQATEGGMAGDDAQGTVGVGVLKQFRLVVNYPAQKISLIERK